MHPSVQNTYNEVAKTLSGLTVKAEKPVRVVTRQKRVMQLAWSMYRAKQAAELKDIELYRAEASPEQFERWFKRNTAFNAKQFGFALQNAHRTISMNECQPVSITDEKSRFIGSDSQFSFRRGI
ncbi:MAG: hypothetical protein NBV76_05380 [Candidatus Ochrobactrum gambitense]|nr:MAG: hypothetical protein NBV76_05380 [Candidatus Ochrobactrum gambitense]WEK17196.1 MAG: hypothetical protein P0Y54_05580 [Candidatus Ochrobactrum gambitense]